jgi:hypothetical protein
MVCQDNHKDLKDVFRKHLTNSGLSNNIAQLFAGRARLSAFLIFRIICETPIPKANNLKVTMGASELVSCNESQISEAQRIEIC